MHIHISYRLHWFGLVVENISRVVNSTFHRLSRQHNDHSYLQVWAQEVYMVGHVNCFCLLNCDIGAERAIIAEMRDGACVSQTMLE